MEHQTVDGRVLLLYWLPLVETNLDRADAGEALTVLSAHLAGRVEHPDLSPDAAAGEDVGVLIAEPQGRPDTAQVRRHN